MSNLMNLMRDNSGVIKSNNTPIVLHGGHYYIFKGDDKPPRCLVKPGEDKPFRVEYTIPPCKLTDFTVKRLDWDPEPWTMFFDHLKLFKCNFLRLWLTGGTEVAGTTVEPKPLDLTPFKGSFVNNKWKWQVQSAVTSNGWNNEYFRKLNKFVTLAEEAGIAVQISLFNYFDLTQEKNSAGFKAWCRSPWNSELSDNLQWGRNNLVYIPGDYVACDAQENNTSERARQMFFIDPNNSLPKVQEALVKKTLETLKGRTNVIYEVMNETRGTHDQISKFNSKVVGWIDAATQSWAYKPLISVNATQLTGGVFDVDYWRDHTAIGNYARVDAISYHGLTGYPTISRTVCCLEKQNVPPVNPENIQRRYDLQFNPDPKKGHNSKALIYCTDGINVRALKHNYKDAAGVDNELEVRDGQFFTNYPNESTFSPEDKRLKSDLQNWAYWCFSAGAVKPGRVHFQNHSLNQISYRRIHDAMLAADASPLKITAIETSEDEA